MRPAVCVILINHMFFFFDKSGQACREWVLGEPVGGAHFDGNETAGDFVFAAGAGFEFLNVIFNRVVDALLEQARAIDAGRIDAQVLTRLSQHELQQIESKLCLMLGLLRRKHLKKQVKPAPH